MKRILLTALATGAMIAAVTPADARDGCGAATVSWTARAAAVPMVVDVNTLLGKGSEGDAHAKKKKKAHEEEKTATVPFGDVVVNAILGSAAVEVISGIDAGAFAGKTLVDVANATTPSFDLVYPDSSLAEKLQDARPDARVVKSMNTAAITTIANPGLIGPSSVFLSGDDAGAKLESAGLLKDLGWADGDIIDLGGIETARGPEHYVVLFAKLAGLLKTEAFNIRVVH